MKAIVFIFIIIILGLYLAPQAYAIIFIPALLLVPIAKIVAVVLTALSVPTTSFAVLWSKMFKKSTKRTILVILVYMLILAVTIIILLKMQNPDRPLF